MPVSHASEGERKKKAAQEWYLMFFVGVKKEEKGRQRRAWKKSCWTPLGSRPILLGWNLERRKKRYRFKKDKEKGEREKLSWHNRWLLSCPLLTQTPDPPRCTQFFFFCGELLQNIFFSLFSSSDFQYRFASRRFLLHRSRKKQSLRSEEEASHQVQPP